MSTCMIIVIVYFSGFTINHIVIDNYLVIQIITSDGKPTLGTLWEYVMV